MPLRALVDGRELQVWNLTGEPWQALKRRSRTAAAALRLACGAPAIARPAAAATRSSPTIPRAARSRPAAGPPRAPFHAGCKLLAASSARAAGWQVRTEAAAADGSWRADVLCRRGACRVALEIQLARTGVVSVKVVEIAGGLEVAIDQAAWGGTSDGGLGVASPSINGGTSSAMASTCM
jgi:hypothetical protein